MSKKLNCIMLIDDDADDNFFHEREIKKNDLEHIIITKNLGIKALEYLKLKEEPQADLIFLDINMPGMNGWEFLREYKQLDKVLQSRAIIIILTTSNIARDVARANAYGFVADYITKPLTREIMGDIVKKYFNQ